jgi:hypothetical protein
MAPNAVTTSTTTSLSPMARPPANTASATIAEMIQTAYRCMGEQ